MSVCRSAHTQANLPREQQSIHSHRSASIGWTFAARRAGSLVEDTADWSLTKQELVRFVAEKQW
jgi:hypothetical protein